ncbi:hypothetical protein ES703_70178 [subsurface metagenome]
MYKGPDFEMRCSGTGSARWPLANASGLHQAVQDARKDFPGADVHKHHQDFPRWHT